MEKHGFNVSRRYLGMDTAWSAEFSFGKGGRVIGLQSEMDALPRIGHACGHNLIAISGVATAIGLKAALETHGIAGTIVLLGTPGMDVCARRILRRCLISLRLQLRNTVVGRSSFLKEVAITIWMFA